ncbi:hypothetical protein [Desulfolithobacter sp.]
MRCSILSLCSLLLLLPSISLATNSTANCHCFKNRSFDPAKKFAADDYLVTTTFNSLVAATFGIEKRQIVMMKMRGGINPEDMLIGLYVAHATPADLDLLLGIRKNGASWKEIVSSPDLATVTDPILDTIRAKGADADTVHRITDFMLIRTLGRSLAETTRLRDQGFSDREIVLLLVLNHLTRVPADSLAAMYREKKMSWSEIADSFRLTPAGVGKRISGS